MLLAGGKKRPDPSRDVAAGAGADNANNDEMPPAEGAMFEGDLDFDFADLNMTAGASAANGRGVGDGEDGGLDFAAIDADLERFEKDDMVREALQRGVDLRLYSKQVDHELRQLEMLSIADCKYTTSGSTIHDRIFIMIFCCVLMSARVKLELRRTSASTLVDNSSTAGWLELPGPDRRLRTAAFPLPNTTVSRPDYPHPCARSHVPPLLPFLILVVFRCRHQGV